MQLFVASHTKAMTRAGKAEIIANLKDQFSQVNSFYVADSSTLTVEDINKFRRICFEKGVKVRVAKNTLIKKALEQSEGEYDQIFDILKGPSTLIFSETANLPAKIINDFRKEHEKPILKAAYVDSAIFIGDEQLAALSKLKSKEELIGDIITLLQSPAKNVISALQSGGSKLAGILKTLAEREEA